MKLFLLLFSLVCLLSGCATTEIVNRIPIPDDLNKSGEIKVCREWIFMGDAAATIIYLDRKPILRSSAGECFAAKIPTGKHILSVMMNGFAGLEMSEIDFDLQPLETKYFSVLAEQIREVKKSENESLNYDYHNVQDPIPSWPPDLTIKPKVQENKQSPQPTKKQYIEIINVP